MSAPEGNASRPALRLGLLASVLVVIFECAYAIALILGLAAREDAGDPIGDPYFSIMELLIVAMMPAFVCLSVAVHATCAPHRRPYALAAALFVAILTAITTSVHASILLLGRTPAFAGMSHVFSFEWPSLVYVLDVLAWDFFFGFFAVFLAFCFELDGFERWIRRVLLASGLLAFAGLAGAAIGDMSLRNIGIAGYVGAFTIAAVLLAVRFAGRLKLATA